MSKDFEKICSEKGLKITGQRRVIAQVLSESDDHPDVETVYKRASKIDTRISVTTVYRTVALFEEFGLIAKHDFNDGRSRYENVSAGHHHHLIDVESGKVIEFTNDKLEKMKEKIASDLGYDLVAHKLELYAKPKKK
ncbi:MAG: Fur family transcriptional regulator [Alphaproteobacteria bacterium]